MRAPAAALAALATVVALTVSACGVAPTPLPTLSGASTAAGSTASTGSATPSPSPSAGSTANAAACPNRLQSYPPTTLPAPGAAPAGSSLKAITDRGRLVVGVSADTYLFGARNPLTNTIEGFDIDLVHAVAKAILGDENKVEFRVITAADRIPLLTAHTVDLVARTFTITCDRWTQIAFSAQYYQAGQKLLVRKGSGIATIAGLAGHTVCAPKGTSSLDTIRTLAPQAKIVPADTHTGCLVKLQQGEVESITGDDTVLAGLAAQDPYAVVLPGQAFTSEPYGIGVAADRRDLVSAVNSALAAYIKDGRWVASYNRWLAPSLGKAPVPPTPQYGRAS